MYGSMCTLTPNAGAGSGRRPAGLAGGCYFYRINRNSRIWAPRRQGEAGVVVANGDRGADILPVTCPNPQIAHTSRRLARYRTASSTFVTVPPSSSSMMRRRIRSCRGPKLAP